jgi:DNA-binding transcriptional LysR family regulator
MDSHAIKAFIAVVDTGSFSVAAENLHLTQPAVSKRIAVLEQQLGALLFNRHPKNITLTQAGSIFLERARTILREIDNAETAISNMSLNVTGTLQVISSHHIGLHRLPPVIKKFLGNYPNVELKMEFMESEKAHQKISRDDADIAFMTLNNSLNCRAASDLLTEHLCWEDPMNIVCALEHPLASIPVVDLQLLAVHRAILPERKTYTYELLEGLFNEESLSLQGSIPTNYLETIKMLVVTGLGWTVLPNTMIDEFMHVLRIEGVSIQRRLGAVSHKKHLLSNAAQAFLAVAREVWPD